MSKWTFVTLIEEAAKYRNRTAFATGSQYAYRQAMMQGLLDHLFPPSEKVVTLPAPRPVRYETSPTPPTNIYEEPDFVADEVERLKCLMDERKLIAD